MYDILYEEWSRVSDAVTKISDAIDWYYGGDENIRSGKTEGQLNF